jgi:ribonuclease D
MTVIETQDKLNALCERLSQAEYVTVDTEFLRERTYWPQLCLIQIAEPGDDDDTAAIIDPMAQGLDLAPVFELMANPNVIKVFHAARQDIEIFYHEGGVIPAPLFDTQVAAMVCGHGDQVGYEALVRRLAGSSLDKSSRFTDWSRRPLSDRQLRYALADVTHLRKVYESLSAEIEKSGRADWVLEEMAVLSDPATYVVEPREAWRRLKTRTSNRLFLSVAREVACWREETAQQRDMPRTRILKDDALLEIAAARPKTRPELERLRLWRRESRKADVATSVLAAVETGERTPAEDRPIPPEVRQALPKGGQAMVDLLKVLLRARCDMMGVASKLVASVADLEQIAAGELEGAAVMTGWRRKVFGADAERLIRGELALSADSDGVTLVPLPGK